MRIRGRLLAYLGARRAAAGGRRFPAPVRDAVARGIAYALVGIVLYNLSDATAKFMTNHVSVPQVALALYVWMILLSLILAPTPKIRGIVRTSHPALQFTQAGCELTGGLMFYMALSYMPFADVIAIGFVSPFFVTVLAALVLKEAVGREKWVACTFGFLGAMIILRPGFSAFGWPSLLPIGAALFSAIYAIITRRIGSRESSATLLFYIGITGAAILGTVLPFTWVAPTPMAWLGLAVVGVLGAAARFSVIRSYSLAPASLIQPFRYLQIVGATVFGLIVFGDFPDLWTWVGTAVIIASGASFYGGEARRRRRAVETAPARRRDPAP
jgi:S-adenosylmethionine uptake transporter